MMLSIKFCGGCNPRINRGVIAEQIRNYFIKYGMAVTFNNLEADIICFISGCSANCAERHTNFTKRFVVIAGTAVDSIAVPEKQLCSIVIEKITELLD